MNWLGMERIAFEVAVKSPLRIGGSGVDVRRDQAGRPCIPATTLKGRTRIEAARLCWTLAWPTCDFPGESLCRPGAAHICPLCVLFGGHGIEGSVAFDHSITNVEPVLTHVHRLSGADVLALPIGTSFMGSFRHRIPATRFRHLALLIASLSAIDRLGGSIGIGWGQCEIRFRTPGLDPVMIHSALWQVEREV
jgi:hypothetical protein